MLWHSSIRRCYAQQRSKNLLYEGRLKSNNIDRALSMLSPRAIMSLCLWLKSDGTPIFGEQCGICRPLTHSSFFHSSIVLIRSVNNIKTRYPAISSPLVLITYLAQIRSSQHHEDPCHPSHRVCRYHSDSQRQSHRMGSMPDGVQRCVGDLLCGCWGCRRYASSWIGNYRAFG